MDETARAAATLRARCCIVGGGPAGMMLGLLLARAGVDTLVLEKHGDFLRDFRGDTIHPSTLELMHELGLLGEFLKRPHNELTQIEGKVGDQRVVVGDFSHLPTHCKFIALMPQWDFLDFLAEKAKRYPAFRLEMECEANDLLIEDGRVVGVAARAPKGGLEIRADLVIGADGRHSTVRDKAGLASDDLGAPIDVLWMRLPKEPGDPPQTVGRFDAGRILVMLDRGDYWQCAFVIRKGGYDEVHERGLPALRDEIARLSGLERSRLEALHGWSDIKLLTVAVDRLRRWYRAGLLCIGDAAHAMSPIGGVGINLAVQDAVAAANLLVPALRRGGSIDDAALARVQRRRELPTRIIQRMQLMIQDRVISRVLGHTGPAEPPWRSGRCAAGRCCAACRHASSGWASGPSISRHPSWPRCAAPTVDSAAPMAPASAKAETDEIFDRHSRASGNPEPAAAKAACGRRAVALGPRWRGDDEDQ